MTPLTSFFRYLPLAGLVAVPLLCSAGCNGQFATVLSSDAGEDASGGGGPGDGLDGGIVTTADSGSTDCATKGGVCLPNGSSAPPNRKLAGTGQGTCTGTDQCWVAIPAPGSFPACYNNAGCNNDPSVSTEWGSCFNGVCMCNTGFSVQPNGKCAPGPGPACGAQGGTCHQNPATCQETELQSASDTDYSCGDLIAAVCCNAKTACTGPAQESAPAGYIPVDFVCCAPTDASHAPICVNGWQTCRAGDTPVAKPGGCK